MSQKLNQIWFSHDYDKLPLTWENSLAILISVCEIDKNILEENQDFKGYDTKIRGKAAFYELNFDIGITLLFYHPYSRSIFTTIRSYSNQKFKYYFDLIGEKFELKRNFRNEK